MAGSSVLELVSTKLQSVSKVGNSFSGFVDGEKNLDEFIRQLESASQVSFMKIKNDTRQTAAGNYTKRLPGEGLLRWKSLAGSMKIEFTGIPFRVEGKKVLECSYGTNRNPHYDNSNEIEREVKPNTLEKLRKRLESEDVPKIQRYYLEVPDDCCHSNHPMGVAAGVGNALNPKVIDKVYEIVKTGITHVTHVRKILHSYVENELFRDCSVKPSSLNNSFYPSDNDIKNHIYRAQVEMKLSKIDQVNLAEKTKQWKEKSPSSSYYFRPYNPSTDPPEN